MSELHSNQIKYKCSSKASNRFSLLIVLMMLGNVYLFPLFKSIDMGELLILLWMPYFLMCNRKPAITKEYKFLYVFISYSVMITLFMCFLISGDIGDPLARLLRDLFYYLIIIYLGYQYFDYYSFKKYLVLFSVILSIFVIVQTLLYFVTGYLMPGFIMGALLNDGGYTGAELYANYLHYASVAGYLKPNGFLCEPAHCAQCFFVALLVLFFSKKCDKDDIKYAIIISIGTVLTMSTSAMLYLMFAWGMWFVKEGKENVIKFFLIIVIVVVFILMAIKHGQLDNVIIVIRRFTNIITGDSITASSQLRMLKGFDVFIALPILQQLLGIGFGNYTAALSLLSNNRSIIMLDNEYMNTVSYLLVSSGIIGFTFICLFFIQMYRRSFQMGRIMIIALLIMSLGSSIYSSPIWVWMMLLILYSNREVQ